MKQIIFTILAFFTTCYFSYAQVASYSFNDGTADDGVASHNGDVYGPTLTEDRFGNANHAFSFDGVDDYIFFGDAPALQMGKGDFSMSVWVKTDSIVSKGAIMGKMNTSANFNQYSIWYNNTDGLINANFFGDEGSFADLVVNTNSIDTSGWNHIVTTYSCDSVDTTYEAILYVNNVAKDTAIYNMPMGNFDVAGKPFVIGRRNAQGDFYFNGTIDDVMLFKTKLSPQQVDSLYNLPAPNPDTTTSINESETMKNLTVFPNPTTGTIQVNNNANLGYINIFDVKGQLLINSTDDKIDLSDFENGIYFLRQYDFEGVPIGVKKIIKL